MPRRLLLACALLPACGPTAAVSATDTAATDTAATAATDTDGPPPTGGEPTSLGTGPHPTTGPSDTTTTTPATTTTGEPGTDPGTTIDQSFITGHDAGNLDSCDDFAQDCPPGHKCAPIDGDGSGTWTVLACVPVKGNVPRDAPCTAPDGPFAGNDDCVAGSICWDLDADNHGVCRTHCDGSVKQPSCATPKSCITAGAGLVHVCVPSCDPLAQDCALGACVPDVSTFVCLDASGTTPINEPCEFSSECEPGLQCVDGMAASVACDPKFGCCQPFCALPDGPCPNPDQACLPVFAKPPEGVENVGSCAIPP